jgi:hypothetical protein
MLCCAITNAGERCALTTAKEETLGRCKRHYDQSRNEQPTETAQREFTSIVRRTPEMTIRIAIYFPEHAARVMELVILRSIRMTMQPWNTANIAALNDFYGGRAAGTKVDVTNFLTAHSTRLDTVVQEVAAVMAQHPRWGPVMRGEPVPAPAPRAPPPPPVGELAAFAADRQNVHTEQTVALTKTVVERVLKIPVPKEYRWNRKTVSRTPGGIILNCRLPPSVAMQMMMKYCATDNVYEMGPGIYGRVLDGVYAYIKDSPDKKDLCNILRSELTDNLGMCAQGNLSRLCNVLAGYLDGIGPQESPADRLGRELPKLLDIGDETRRMEVARGVLRDTGLPETEWAPWLDALA